MRRGLLAALLVVTIVGLGLFAARSRRLTPGPLGAETGALDYTHHIGVGERFSIGGALLLNGTNKPATIERVRVVGVTDGLEVLGVRTRPLPDQGKGMFLGALDYPPPEYPSRPLAEQNIVRPATSRTPAGTPGDGLELVIGVRATRPGIARFRAVEFTYRLGGRRYRAVNDGNVYLCAPVGRYGKDECPGPVEGEFSSTTVEAKSG